MIIFGSRAAHVATKSLKNSTCPSCGKDGTLNLSVFRKHAHVFWIPMFPYAKKGVSQCSHCKNVLEKKEMPERLRTEYEKLKAESKGPIWQFSGLILLTGIVLFVVFQNNQDEKDEQVFISAPEKGDIYYQKLGNGHYTTMRVSDKVNDSIILEFNAYEIDKMSQVYKIDKEENYESEKFAIHKTDLKTMYDSDEIYRISRK